MSFARLSEPMSSAPTPQEIWKNARWLAQAVDPGAGLVRLVDMSQAAYREASFLDDRMFQQPRVSHLVKWGDVAAAMPTDARRDARWIFHISHVGSTLIARMLGEIEGVLSIRETRAFRDLTFFPPDARARYIPGVQALFSRTFARSGAAVVKTTSFVSEIAGELIPADRPALYLYAGPRSFISGMLAGQNSRGDLVGPAKMRAEKLASRGIDLPEPRNDADLAAAAWACGMTALEAAGARNVLWADFDRVLDDLEGELGRMAAFFGFDASPKRIREIAQGPLAQRYSKATQFEYGPEVRRALLDSAEKRFRSDIDAALAMLDAAAETSPVLTKALERARAES